MADQPKKQGVGEWERQAEAAPQAHSLESAGVGGLVLGEGDLELNAGRPTTELDVRNTGDRPVQVCSHYHFFETNRALEFDRPASFGKRLDIPAGTAIRFEPGDQKKVTLVPYGGKQRCYGFNNLVDGWTGEGPTPDYRPNYDHAVKLAQALGFKSSATKP